MSRVVVPLPGCTPEPLMGYLKALGILRLVGEQVDPHAAGAWRGDCFVLTSTLDAQALVRFFLDEYRPSPIISPWNQDGGFLSDGGDTVALLRRFEDATEDARLGPLGAAIAQARTAAPLRSLAAGKAEVKALNNKKSAAKKGGPALSDEERRRLAEAQRQVQEDKDRLLRGLRDELPDSCVRWLDACLVLGSEKAVMSPILGSGGLDGRTEFSVNFLRNVLRVLEEPGASEGWLLRSLFGTGGARRVKATMGPFAPGCVGGPNATQGMEGDAAILPWDYVLLIEGAVLFAGSLSRRLTAAARTDPKAAFPFTVLATGVGEAGVDDADARAARGELWLPLWPRPATLAEVRHLFAEGRAEWGRRQSRSAVDFARAVASLGVDRGITAFTRQGFLKRKGKDALAVPLGRFEVARREHIDLLREIDPWLEEYRRAASEKAPRRFRAALHRIDEAIIEACRHGAPGAIASVLCALGAAEREVARTEGKVGTIKRPLPPVAPLSPEWLDAIDDGSAELDLARALASVCDGRPDPEKRIPPIRANLEPAHTFRRRDGSVGAVWAERDRSVVWTQASPITNLAAVLERRLLDGERQGSSHPPIDFVRSASLANVARLLRGEIALERLDTLLWGLVLVRFDGGRGAGSRRPTAAPGSAAGLSGHLSLPRAFALLKLLFLPRDIELSVDQGQGEAPARLVGSLAGASGALRLAPDRAILGLLRARRVEDALRLATRRLRARGLTPLGSEATRGSADLPDQTLADAIDPEHLAAALLVPIASRDVGRLARLVLRPNLEGVG